MQIGIAVAVALAASVLGPTGNVMAGAADKLPDFELARPHDMSVQVAPNNRKRLRFGSVVYNVGDGPMEMRASNRQSTVMTNVRQRIYRTDDTFRDVPKDVRVSYEDDGHNHFHIRKFIVASLTRLDGSAPIRRLRKIGFCLVDTLQRSPAVPGTGSARFFGCGTRYSQSVTTGISLGWGDVYSPNTRYQQIDVTGLPTGSYLLCATVNPLGAWSEKNGVSSNNSYWFVVNLNPSAATVVPTDEGDGPCPA